MGLLEDINKLSFIGSEFLLWLWYMSDKNNGLFDVEGFGKFELWIYDKVKLEKNADKEKEILVCSGAFSELREAKLGLIGGKRITEARLKCIIDEEEWFMTLDSMFLDLKQLKTPKVEISKDADEAEKEAMFYEKVFLIEKAISMIDNLFASFLNHRLSSGWSEERIAIKRWMSGDEDDSVDQS
ncbi:MAG: hypothetical protein D6828_00980 [Nitrospirae bacterium]|nr:MAG: hypothetical protein D6828_00980 [Nitrospirota bacterium]